MHYGRIGGCVLAMVLGLATSALAEVKTIAYYRLGESDPAAAPGKAIEQSADENHGPALHPWGKTPVTYEPAGGLSAAVSSQLAASFAGNSYLRRTGFAIPGNDNFGIEAFVKAQGDDALQYIVCWGDGTRGYALMRNKQVYQVLLGGIGFVGSSGEVPAGQWVHLALVRTEGKTTLYVNGEAKGDSSLRPINLGPGDGLLIGAPGDGKEGLFRGSIDEVRVFTFDKGKFDPKDLFVTHESKTP